MKNLARLIVRLGNENMDAFLGEDLHWYSPNPLLQSILRTDQTPYSSADGIPGKKMLAQAVERMRERNFMVEWEWLDERPAEPASVVH